MVPASTSTRPRPPYNPKVNDNRFEIPRFANNGHGVEDVGSTAHCISNVTPRYPGLFGIGSGTFAVPPSTWPMP